VLTISEDKEILKSNYCKKCSNVQFTETSIARETLQMIASFVVNSTFCEPAYCHSKKLI